MHLKAKDFLLTRIFVEKNRWKCRMCLRLLRYCPAYFLVKDSPLKVQCLSNQWETRNSCNGCQPRKRERCGLCFSTIRKCCAREPFTRRVIYRWNWIVVKAGHCPVHLAKGWGRTDTCSWCMLCLFIVCLNHVPAIAKGLARTEHKSSLILGSCGFIFLRHLTFLWKNFLPSLTFHICSSVFLLTQI